MSPPEIRILKTAQELFAAAATEFAAQAAAAVRTSGRFTVALSGGSTPKSLYALLAATPGIPWTRFAFSGGRAPRTPGQSREQLPRGP